MNIDNIVSAISSIEENRNVSQEIIVDALKEALAKAFRKQINVPDANVSVEIDEQNGELRLFQQYEVVEEVEDDELQVEYSEIIKHDPSLEVGQFYKVEHSIDDIGRAAALLAKQVLKQKIREAEKQAVYDEYIDKLDEMIIGEIESVEEKFAIVNLGKALAVMPRAQQIPGEYYREGQRYRVVITEVIKDTKGAQVIVSRSDEKLVKRLFEKEVPEIYDGVVEIKAIAREAGERTKMAVHSKNPEIDPIGACIGPRGSRVQVVIEELKGEKIDIFEWSENPIELIKNSLSPAQVVAVFPNPEKKGLMVVVEDSQLSLAIGKRGKNARLAVRLTGSKIDIKSQTEALELGIDYFGLMAQYQAAIDEKNAAVEDPTEEIIVDEELEIKEELDFEEELEVDEELIEEDSLTEEDEIKEEEIIAEQEEVEEEKPIKFIKEPLKPRHDYVSKFESIAAGKRQQDQPSYGRRKKEKESEKRLNTADLLKEIDYEILPEYTEEELAEIEAQQEAEEKELWEMDIDYDQYDEYYDEE